MFVLFKALSFLETCAEVGVLLHENWDGTAVLFSQALEDNGPVNKREHKLSKQLHDSPDIITPQIKGGLLE